MKKIAAIILTAAMVVSLAGCSSSETSKSTEDEGGKATETVQETKETETQGEDSQKEWDFSGITLNLAHSTTGDVSDAFDAQFAAFEELTGCKIEVEHLSSNADENENTILVRAATGNLPDIWQNSVGAKLQNVSPQENVYDLSGQDWICLLYTSRCV